MSGFDDFYKMGITKEKSDFSLDIKFPAPEWKIKEKEISANDIKFNATDGGIFYNGRRVILYIRDQAQYFSADRISEYKFHLAACSTVKSMLAQNRYEKYVITENTIGVFKNNIYQNFSIKEFFASVNNDNQKNFDVTPEYIDATAPLNVYPPNWNKISKVIRTENGYICEDCGRIFPDGRGLQVHHKNGIKILRRLDF